MSKRSFSLIVGLTILAGFLLMALFPGVLSGYGQKEMFAPWGVSSPKHILGTNALGYDIFTELVYGARETLLVGIASSILSLILGAIIGTVAAHRGFCGTLANGIINIFVMLPKLVTLIVLAAFVGNSSLNLILLISAFSWVGTARNVRAKVIHLQSLPFIECCSIYGYSKLHIQLHHIIPNLQDVLLSRFLLGVNGCIMMESTLSFLGFGDLYHPTWGTMINFAYQRGAFLRKAYGYLIVPGICIMLLSLSFYFLSQFIQQKKQVISED